MDLDLSIGPILLPAFLVGWIQGLKELLGLEGGVARWATALSGFVFVALAWGISENIIPEEAHKFIIWLVVSLAGSVAAMGYYALWRDGFRDRSGSPSDRSE